MTSDRPVDEAALRGHERHARGWAAGGGLLGEAGRVVLQLAAEVRRLRTGEAPTCSRCLRPLPDGAVIFCGPGCQPDADPNATWDLPPEVAEAERPGGGFGGEWAAYTQGG